MQNVDKCDDFHFAAGQSIQEENQRCHRDGGLMGSTLRAFFFFAFSVKNSHRNEHF